MGTSIVDGTVEEAVIKRQRGRITIYSPLTFRLDGGGSRTIKTAVASGEVADHLKPGSSGRFYLFTALDVKGVHGARTAGGSAFDFPARNNELIFIFVIIINILWIALRVGTDTGLPLFGVAMLLLGGVGLFFTRKSRMEAKTQFETDQSPA